MKKEQKGMTFIGMLLIVVLVSMGGILAMRIIPVYIRYYSVLQSVKNLNLTSQKSLTGDANADSEVLKSIFLKSLEVNGVYDFKESDISITPTGYHTFQVKFKYHEISRLMFNINLMFDFDKTLEVVVNGEN